MTNKGVLEVFDPTDKFIRFVFKNYLPWQIEIERYPHTAKLKSLVFRDYKSGSYDGIIGVCAYFNDKHLNDIIEREKLLSE